MRHRVPWRLVTFLTLLLAYAGLTVALLHPTPVLALDRWFHGLNLRHSIPEGYKRWISWYVALGQRGPATAIFLPWFVWVARRERSPRPLILLGVALLLLNVSVGVVKESIGRLGPLRTHNVSAFFDGGNIYPSGHISNVVVLYGLIAWIAVKHRRLLIGVTVWLCLTVGLGTIYLNTHWFSDVVGGWLAGALVLVALPWCMPWVERRVETARRRVRARRHRERGEAPPVRPPTPVRPLVTPSTGPVGS